MAIHARTYAVAAVCDRLQANRALGRARCCLCGSSGEAGRRRLPYGRQQHHETGLRAEQRRPLETHGHHHGSGKVDA